MAKLWHYDSRKIGFCRLNGITIINKQEIPGITGGAMDSNEGEAGPIMIQGDHGPVEYRNIVLTPGK